MLRVGGHKLVLIRIVKRKKGKKMEALDDSLLSVPGNGA